MYAFFLYGADALGFTINLIYNRDGTQHPPGSAVIGSLFLKQVEAAADNFGVLLKRLLHGNASNVNQSGEGKQRLFRSTFGTQKLQVQSIPLSINCRGRRVLFDQPLLMGILNITPDSFYSGSLFSSDAALLKKAEQMLADGAMFIDMGGQSTRPGSQTVSAEEELARIIPAVQAVHKAFPHALVSIDTFYASVAQAAADAGASLINDVSSGTIDPQLWPLLPKLGLPYVLSHIQGRPQTMQQSPHYENVVLEVFDDVNKKRHQLQEAGVTDVIIDPGFGFGKTINHNLQLLHALNFFGQMNCPLMVGLSRKGTVYKTLGVSAEEALNGSTVLHTIALLHGAQLLRVHDVKEAAEAVKLVAAYGAANKKALQV